MTSVPVDKENQIAEFFSKDEGNLYKVSLSFDREKHYLKNIITIQFQTLQTWTGSKKKITTKFFLEAAKTGSFYPPEGSSFFYEDGSMTLYNTGGGKHCSTRSWPLGAKIFQIKLSPDEDYDRSWFDVESIKILETASGSSSVDCMFSACPITIKSSEDELLGTGVGKNLQFMKILNGIKL